MWAMSNMFALFPLFFVGVFVLVAVAFFYSFRTQARDRRDAREGRVNELEDARARAERWISRLGNELLVSSPTDDRSKELMGMAAQRHSAAMTRVGDARTPDQAKLAGDVAIEGLHYMRDARRHLGDPEGPPLPDVR